MLVKLDFKTVEAPRLYGDPGAGYDPDRLCITYQRVEKFEENKDIVELPDDHRIAKILKNLKYPYNIYSEGYGSGFDAPEKAVENIKSLVAYPNLIV